MRFKIIHLLILITALAFAIQFVNSRTFERLNSRIIDVRLTPDAGSGGTGSKFDYIVVLELNRPNPNGLPTVIGWRNFGYCSFTKTQIDQQNYQQLLGMTPSFRYRTKRFLWLAPDEFGKLFDVHFEKKILTGL